MGWNGNRIDSVWVQSWDAWLSTRRWASVSADRNVRAPGVFVSYLNAECYYAPFEKFPLIWAVRLKEQATITGE